jgi:hypothetical protein
LPQDDEHLCGPGFYRNFSEADDVDVVGNLYASKWQCADFNPVVDATKTKNCELYVCENGKASDGTCNCPNGPDGGMATMFTQRQ